jgi:hypothetical protein
MAARFVALLPDRPAQAWWLADGREYVAGRDPGCDLSIDDDRVSRRHLSLRATGEGWRLRDLESKNGTWIDGRRIGEATLGSLTWLGLGSLAVRFEPDAPGGDRERVLAESATFERELATAVDEGEVLERLLAAVIRASGMERAFVLLAGAGGGLEVAARHGLASDDLLAGGFRGSVGAVERALASGTPVACHDTAGDALGARRSVREEGIRALVCLPLTGPAGKRGALYADSRVVGRAITELDLELLASLADHALVAVGLARARRELTALVAPAVAAEPALAWQGIVAAHAAGEGP